MERLFRKVCIIVVVLTLIVNVQSVSAQDGITSVKLTVKNVTLSSDAKTLSYEVYLKDVDATYPVECPGFTIRLAVLQSELGTNPKTVSVVSGPSNTIGVQAPTMIVSGSNWLMKFQNLVTPLVNAGALRVSDIGDGTLLGTFSITNTDGTAFANPLNFTLLYSGSTISTKSTVAVFIPGTVTLGTNPSTAQPETNFIAGLQAYSLRAITTSTSHLSESVKIYPTVISEGFHVSLDDNKNQSLNIYDLQGVNVYSQNVYGNAYVNVKSLKSGVYVVKVGDLCQRMVKK